MRLIFIFDRFSSSFFSLLLILPLLGQTSQPLLAQSNKDPKYNFEALWKHLDKEYSNFAGKEVDWKDLYEARVFQIGPKTTTQQLFDDMGYLLDALDDRQLILTGNLTMKVSGLEDNISVVRPVQAIQAFKEETYGEMSLNVIEEQYLEQEFDIQYDSYRMGWMKDSIAYLHLRKFGDILEADSMMNFFSFMYGQARALVIDVRACTGGSDKTAKIIADHFADQRRQYMIAARREPESHESFGPKRYWHIEPRPDRNLNQPLIVLTSRSSWNAAEKFALAMGTLPQVLLLGDTTRGVLADVREHSLPNGWKISYPYIAITDHMGNSLEGIGLCPDSVVLNSSSQIKRGIDNQLGTAHRILRLGWRGGEADSTSLTRVTSPQYLEALEKGVETDNWEEAILNYLAKREDIDQAHYVQEAELLAIADKLRYREMNEQAKQLYKEIILLEYPQSLSANLALGYLAISAGEETEARKYFHTVLELHPKHKEAKKQMKELKSGRPYTTCPIPKVKTKIRVVRAICLRKGSSSEAFVFCWTALPLIQSKGRLIRNNHCHGLSHRRKTYSMAHRIPIPNSNQWYLTAFIAANTYRNASLTCLAI